MSESSHSTGLVTHSHDRYAVSFCDAQILIQKVDDGSHHACCEAREGYDCLLNCGPGYEIAHIAFAAYGEPTGVCHSYQKKDCDVGLISYGIAQRNCVSRSSCALHASSETFLSSEFPHSRIQDDIGCNYSSNDLALKVEAVCIPSIVQNTSYGTELPREARPFPLQEQTEKKRNAETSITEKHSLRKINPIDPGNAKHMTSCDISWIGDGWCDDINNNAGCDFDGGDCCWSTCVSSTYTCGVNGYDCQGYSYSDCYSGWIGDGYCDSGCNSNAYNYDGGDCCPGSNCRDCSLDGWYCSSSLCAYGGCYLSDICDSCSYCPSGRYSRKFKLRIHFLI